MTGRVTLPAVSHPELADRARPGRGYDPDAPANRRTPPSSPDLELVAAIVRSLRASGAHHVAVIQDPQGRNHPGAILICWGRTPAPYDVASEHATATAPDGTPLLPAWLALRNDDDFDLRWQPPLAH